MHFKPCACGCWTSIQNTAECAGQWEISCLFFECVNCLKVNQRTAETRSSINYLISYFEEGSEVWNEKPINAHLKRKILAEGNCLSKIVMASCMSGTNKLARAAIKALLHKLCVHLLACEMFNLLDLLLFFPSPASLLYPIGMVGWLPQQRSSKIQYQRVGNSLF